jgi:phosphonate transport system substrate-binding protein
MTLRTRPALSVTALVGGTLILTVLLLGAVFSMRSAPPPPPPESTEAARNATAGQPIRFAVVPERDIFEQRARFVSLSQYLEAELGRPIDLLTLNSYQAVIDALGDGRADMACLGSMAAVLAMDRMGARVLAKPVQPDGVDVYHGLLLVRADSGIDRIEALRGRSVAMIRTTTAGHLFPIQQFVEHGLLNGQSRVRLLWVGTHDDALTALLAGDVDAAALKDLRLAAHENEHGPAPVRELARSGPVPTNAVFVRRDLEAATSEALRAALLGMEKTGPGRTALKALGIKRFAPCDVKEYGPAYDLIEKLEPVWDQMGVEGPPPKRSDTRGEKGEGA